MFNQLQSFFSHHWTKIIYIILSVEIIGLIPVTSTHAQHNTDLDNIMPNTSTINTLTVADIWNNGDASDIQVQFNPAPDTEHHIMIVKAENAVNFDLDSAEQIPDNRYTVIDNSEDDTFELPSTATDIDGDPIVEDTPYVIFVLSINSDQSTLSPSDEITLRNETIVRTLVPELQVSTGGVAVDQDGNIYIGNMGLAPDRQGTEVFRITLDGEVEVFADGFFGASGNAFDSDGNLYQSSFSGDTVSRITPDGEVSEYVTEGVNGPVGIAVAEDGTLYIASCANGSVYQASPDGQIERLVLSPLLACPNGIALADDGNLYVANFTSGRIVKIGLDGTASDFVTLPGRNNGHILFANGLLYVTARTANQIYTITLDGEVELLAGSGERGHDDGSALEATFSLPNDINISPDGRVLYVNEVFNVNRDVNNPSVVRMVILARESD